MIATFALGILLTADALCWPPVADVNDAAQAYARAVSAISAGKTQEGMDGLAQTAARHPWLTVAHWKMAETDDKRASWLWAYAAYKRYLWTAPPEADRAMIKERLAFLEQKSTALGFYAEGERAAAAGEWPRVIDAMLKTIDNKPRFALAYRLLGRAYAATGDSNRAGAAFAKYLERDPLAPDKADVARAIAQKADLSEAPPITTVSVPQGLDDVPLMVPQLAMHHEARVAEPPAASRLADKPFHLGIKIAAAGQAGALGVGTLVALEAGFRLPIWGRRLGFALEPGVGGLWTTTLYSASGIWVDVGALLTYHEPLGPGLLRVLAGPSFDWISSHGARASGAYSDSFAAFGASAGGGYVWPLGGAAGALVIEARYRVTAYVVAAQYYIGHGATVGIGYSFFL